MVFADPAHHKDHQRTIVRKVASSKLLALTTASGAAVLGDALAFPLDTLKVRMQMRAERVDATARALWRGGIAVIYSGISASALRQATYGGLRLSLYEPIRNILHKPTCQSAVPFHMQIIAGAISGGISSAIMCPTDVLKIRLQGGDAQYRGIDHALRSIVQREGVLKLWRGVVPTSTRASVVAAAELGIYDATKCWLVEAAGFATGVGVVLASSWVATVGAIAVSFPIDVAKTIMINQGLSMSSSTATNIAPRLTNQQYRGMLHCLRSIVRERGLLGIYRGAGPSLARQLVCNGGTFVAYEQLKGLFWLEKGMS